MPFRHARLRGFARAALRVVVALMRVAVVLGAVNVSGFVHVASDVVTLVAHGDSHEEEDCDAHDCPPGCPSCHHVHSGGALPLAATDFVLAAFDPGSELLPPPSSVPPPEGALRSVDRPPRA
ncbi:MAG: hypothetical protein U0169_14200 [Polyangiaceae bacterium]